MSMRSATRVGRGSLNGTLEKREDQRPGLRGSIAFESDVTVKAGQHLHLVAWVRDVRGVPFVSLVVESDLA
jgi:hypothetical protein